MFIDYAVNCSVGKVRKENQDNYFLNGEIKKKELANKSSLGKSDSDVQSFAVCDGMGGEDCGETAAYLAVKVLKDYASQELFHEWNQYITKANQEIFDFATDSSIQSGTTFSGLFFCGNRFTAVNVGDSRIYRITCNGIEQLSEDHTEFQMLVKSGKLKKEDFPHTNSHNRLTQHLGIDPEEMIIEPYQYEGQVVAKEEYFLLCSDGLYGSMSEAQLKEIILAKDFSLSAKCDKMVETALVQGSRDNVTAMLIRCEQAVGDQEIIKMDSPGNKSSGNKYLLLGCLAFVILLAFFGRFLFSRSHSDVKNVVGISSEEAVAILEEDGFRVKCIQAYDPEVEMNCVVSQSVEEGTRLNKNDLITLTISKGAEPVTLPDVYGMDANEASSILESCGFIVEVQEVYSKDIKKGHVIEQSPSAGMNIIPGEEITLTVSKGNKGKKEKNK